MLVSAPDAPVAQTAPAAAPLVAHPVLRGSLSLELYQDLADVATIWRAFEAGADCTVFQTFAWHRLWQEHVGEATGTKPAIVVGRAGGGVVLLLPLAVKTTPLARRLVWHAGDLCDYNGPLLATDFTTALASESFVQLWRRIADLVAAAPGLAYDVTILRHMPERIGGQRNPFLDLAPYPSSSSAHYMRIYGPWDTFYRDKRSSATRRHDRAKMKRLVELGAVRFETPEEPCAVASVLEALFTQKAAQFAARGVANFLARPGRQAFLRAAALDAALRGTLHVSQLAVGSQVAAANLGFVFRGRYYHFLASYDGGSIGRFGPGTAHLHALVDYAIRRGCSIFDFTVGDEPYKRDWCEGEERMFDYRAPRTLRGGAVATVLSGATHAKHHIKQTPQLWAAYVQARRLIAWMRIGWRGGRVAAATNGIERSAGV